MKTPSKTEMSIVIQKLLGKAEQKRQDAAHGGEHGDGGASVIEDKVKKYKETHQK